MIVVDTSALIALILGEHEHSLILQLLQSDERFLLSSANLTELFIVAARRGIFDEASALIDRSPIVLEPVSERLARLAAQAYRRWGKGIADARLNFGDCFAYALAMERGCPLLFVGEDFARTDVRSALGDVAPRA